jgi:hypothetical protein
MVTAPGDPLITMLAFDASNLSQADGAVGMGLNGRVPEVFGVMMLADEPAQRRKGLPAYEGEREGKSALAPVAQTGALEVEQRRVRPAGGGESAVVRFGVG